MGTQFPPKGQTPNFQPMSVVARCIKMPLGTEVGLGQGCIVLDGDPAPPKGHSSSPLSAHVYCGQTAGWIKVPLGTEIGLGPGDIVLHRNPAPSLPERGTAAPSLFCPCLLWPNDWMDPNTSWYRGRPRARRCCVRWGPSSPWKGTQQPPLFGPICSGTVAHLSCCSALVKFWGAIHIFVMRKARHFKFGMQTDQSL